MLPVLLILLSGLIEFGFLLNTYLDVIDAAREAARFAANDDPTQGIPAGANFWNRAFTNSRGSLVTASDGRIAWNWTDWTDCSALQYGDYKSDIVVSAFGLENNAVQTRYPLTKPNGYSNCNQQLSKFTNADINTKMDSFSIANSGAVLVEIYYEYDMLLGLPWITMFVPNGIVLHAYTIMPNTYAEPPS